MGLQKNFIAMAMAAVLSVGGAIGVASVVANDNVATSRIDAADTAVTFDATSDKASSATAGACSLQKSDVTIETTQGIFGNGTDYRIYKSQTFKVSTSSGTIVSFVATCTAENTAKYGPGCFTDATSGTYSYSGVTGTWTGNSSSVTLTASSNQVRVTKLVVTVRPTTVYATGIALSSEDFTITDKKVIYNVGDESGCAVGSLLATITPDNATTKTVTWTSSDDDMCDVDGGDVSLNTTKKGTYRVTAKADGAASGSTVNDYVDFVVLSSEPSLTLELVGETTKYIGDTVEVNATSYNIAGDLQWGYDESYFKNVTTNNSKFTGTLIKLGNEIEISAQDSTGTASDIVAFDCAQSSVTGITLSPKTLDVNLGNSETITVEVAKVGNPEYTIVWSTSDDSVAAVNNNGKVTGIASGTATITSTIQGTSIHDTCTVTVSETPAFEIVPNDFTGSYSSAATLTKGSYVIYHTNVVKQTHIQIKNSSTAPAGMYNSGSLGKRISKIVTKMNTGSVTFAFSNEQMDFTSAAAEEFHVSDASSETIIVPENGEYDFFRVKSYNDTTPRIEYIKVYLASFTPTISLSPASVEFTYGDAEYSQIESAITGKYCDGATYSATSEDTSVVPSDAISIESSKLKIDGTKVTAGSANVVVSANLDGEKVAEAKFAVACLSAERNLISLAITEQAAKTTFEVGEKFNIDGLAVEGTFDAAPTKADVTEDCHFRMMNGATKIADLVPGTTQIPDVSGSYKIEIYSDTEGVAAVSYNINVIRPSNVTLEDTTEWSFGYNDTGVREKDLSCNDGSLSSKMAFEYHGIYKNGGIQMNTGKETYIKNTYATPGPILRLEITWSSGTAKNTPTIYFSDSYISSTPSSGGTKATVGETEQIIKPSGGAYYFYFDGTTVPGSCVMSELKVVYAETDSGVAKHYESAFLHMNEYDTEKGYCSDSTHGYYAKAKDAYSNLTNAQVALLSEGAKARLSAWAIANGEVFNATDGSFTANNIAGLLKIGEDDATSCAIIAVIGFSVCLASFFFLRKKRA